jgi:hypothetical protein
MRLSQRQTLICADRPASKISSFGLSFPCTITATPLGAVLADHPQALADRLGREVGIMWRHKTTRRHNQRVKSLNLAVKNREAEHVTHEGSFRFCVNHRLRGSTALLRNGGSEFLSQTFHTSYLFRPGYDRHIHSAWGIDAD